jgi:hypothetical protein
MPQNDPQSAGSSGGGKQLNQVLGENTVQFHLDGTMPNPGALNGAGGTPNQKMERLANRIAFWHFVNPNKDEAAKALKDTLDILRMQAEVTGHQCIANQDEALTQSHGPIWLRAMMSLRITSQRLASRGGDYAELERRVLDWIEFHTTMNALGTIPSGDFAQRVFLPGARWKEQNLDGTDQVTDVVHQLITLGKVVSPVGGNFFKLSLNAPDRAGAVLAKQILDKGIGFGNATGGRMPKLRSRFQIQHFEDGYLATFPDGMPFADKPSVQAFVVFSTGQRRLSNKLGDPAAPKFQGTGRDTVIQGS